MSLPKDSSEQPSAIVAKRRLNRRRARIVVLALATIILFALLFVQAAFNTLKWLRPSSVSETLSLYVLSTINFLAFLVLLMVLVRNIIKLRRERLQRKLGARFKTRLVVIFIALSLLPVTFLFLATRGLINRSIEKWFSLPGDEMLTTAHYIQSSYIDGEKEGLNRIAIALARGISRAQDDQIATTLSTQIDAKRLLLAQHYNVDGQLVEQVSGVELSKLGNEFRTTLDRAYLNVTQGVSFDSEVNDEGFNTVYLVSAVPVPAQRGGSLIVAQELPQKYAASVNKIRELQNRYESLKKESKSLSNSALQTLSVITLLVLFIAFWLALYVARSIAEPVRQMAEATERIKRGDLSYRAGIVGDDELAALALSFNEMTAELAENRRRLEQSTLELQQINAVLDERRRYIETVLQSLSSGVISLDENANVTTINEAALKLLRMEERPLAGVPLETMVPVEQREELRKMILRAAPMRSLTREVHFTLANHTKLDAAVTVTALQDPRGQSRGAVIVIEDLTELIEAQRRAAWSEIARRMAHEIKNPLTPIRLSAERLAKNLLRESNGRVSGGGRGDGSSGGDKRGRDANDDLSVRQTELVRECTAMIGAEVATLQRMVDEFSNFARLPNARLETASLNEVVIKTLKLYDERLNGIRLESNLAVKLPPVMIDSEQIKRLLVNLIDNAAEALGDSSENPGVDRLIAVSTLDCAERESVELIVADTGPGIPLDDRERIFDPYFSTRKRGTGLGLAIVSRIVAEHQGRIRMQDNAPRGVQFIIELPAASIVES
jgi:two-component system, NtrC family, nitrogen regulation sensor histidine kinase NtrY